MGVTCLIQGMRVTKVQTVMIARQVRSNLKIKTTTSLIVMRVKRLSMRERKDPKDARTILRGKRDISALEIIEFTTNITSHVMPKKTPITICL